MKIISKNFSLSKKLTILMFAIFLGGFIVSSLTYYNVLLGDVQKELDIKANLLISTMDSVRKYNNDHVIPLLKKQSEEKLLSESVPDASVRKVFDILTNVYKNDYGEYRYKNAMFNPTNTNDAATEIELNIIKKLSQQDQSNKFINNIKKNIDQGFTIEDGIKKYYTARPIKITQSNCLSCHASLEKSPRSLRVLYEEGKYKDNQGFGWELNKVIGTKILYIPADKVYNAANKKFLLMIQIFITIFAIAILLVTLWLKKYVVRPLNQITKIATALSMGDMNAEFKQESNDEVGRLTEAFVRLKTSLVIAIRKLDQKS